MARKRCEKKGHKWKAWSPGAWEAHCGRIGCKARTKTELGQMWDKIIQSIDSPRHS